MKKKNNIVPYSQEFLYHPCTHQLHEAPEKMKITDITPSENDLQTHVCMYKLQPIYIYIYNGKFFINQIYSMFNVVII